MLYVLQECNNNFFINVVINKYKIKWSVSLYVAIQNGGYDIRNKTSSSNITVYISCVYIDVY